MQKSHIVFVNIALVGLSRVDLISYCDRHGQLITLEKEPTSRQKSRKNAMPDNSPDDRSLLVFAQKSTTAASKDHLMARFIDTVAWRHWLSRIDIK